MRETLIVIGLLVLAAALRSYRKTLARKLGAMVFVATAFLVLYFPTRSIWAGVCGAGVWLLLPWVELLTRIRRMRQPLDNRLQRRTLPDPAFFPNAPEAAAAMAEAGFEHASDCGWEWDGMKQFFRLFWHPEERAVAAVCLCEQTEIVYSFIAILSRDDEGRLWRTTNYPFSPTLKCPPHVRWNHVPCHRNCFHQILRDHRAFLASAGVLKDDLRVPDPDEIDAEIEREMRIEIDHNLALGIIRLTGDGHFEYSKRGLVFLWGQFVKDMVRLC